MAQNDELLNAEAFGTRLDSDADPKMTSQLPNLVVGHSVEQPRKEIKMYRF